MNFWKEGLATAFIAVLGEKLLVKSNHLPEAFVSVFAATIIAKYIKNIEWSDTKGTTPYNPLKIPQRNITPANRV